MSPICISDEKVELSGWGYIAGWGITKEKGFQSHELLEATLPIFDTNKCNMRYGGKIDGETQFCAGYSKLKSENALTFNIYLFVFKSLLILINLNVFSLLIGRR